MHTNSLQKIKSLKSSILVSTTILILILSGVYSDNSICFAQEYQAAEANEFPPPGFVGSKSVKIGSIESEAKSKKLDMNFISVSDASGFGYCTYLLEAVASDGTDLINKVLRFNSSQKASKELNAFLNRTKKIIKTMPFKNKEGKIIGKKVVALVDAKLDPNNSKHKIVVAWNDESELYLIYGASKKHVALMEDYIRKYH